MPDKTKNYTAVSFQRSTNCVFSYRATFFQRKLWQYRLLPSHSFATVGYKITEIGKIRQKHTSMTVNASLLETGKNPGESIRKVYLLSTVGVFNQWNSACLKLTSSEIPLWKGILLFTDYREPRFLPKAPELNA